MPFNQCNINIRVNTLSCNYKGCIQDMLPHKKFYNDCVQDKAPKRFNYGNQINGGSPCDLPKCYK